MPTDTSGTSAPSAGSYVWLRRGVQIFFLALFLLLFLKTEYAGQEKLAWPVDLFFRFDPLILAVNLATGSPLVTALFWSLAFVVLTLVLGRFFCGWVCPLGTTLDVCRRTFFTPRPDRGLAARWRRGKYYILVFILAAAVFRVNLAGLLDPLSLLHRTLALTLYPGLSRGLESLFAQFYQWGEPLTHVSEPLYKVLKATILPFQPLVFLLPWFTLVIFVTLVLLERLDRRFWCRALCPLGALYGLAARFARLRRRPAKLCPDCGNCADLCKMGAVPAGDDARHRPDECQLCLRCLETCPENRVSFRFKDAPVPRPPLDLGRRQVVTTLALGVAAAPLLRLGSLAPPPDEYLLRPPGTGKESEFLAKCVRCGLCFNVCPTGALQPTWWQAGLEGLYTARLVPRLGYCEYGCNLCSQVCPTGAIPPMPLEVKQAAKMGTAFIDRSRCIPFSEGIDCMVCEEHCPVAPKAITFFSSQVWDATGKPVTVNLPVVSEDRCIGCGICENKCPVGGHAAIRVKRSLRMEV